jgi:Family of unknown function (DUF6516)
LTSLPRLLSSLVAILQSHPSCKKILRVETQEFSIDQFFFKIRVALAAGATLQVRIYYNQGHIDYAYQVFSDRPLWRWDNKEEFINLASYPHHFHDNDGYVKQSPLIGDPLTDIPLVLQQLTEFYGESNSS